MSTNLRPKSTYGDWRLAQHLAEKVFPGVLASGTITDSLKRHAVSLGIPYSTIRRKYYEWKAIPEPETLLDGRLQRGCKVPDNEAFLDFMGYFVIRKNAETAFADLKEDYEKRGAMLPTGFSLVNLRRYVKRAAAFAVVNDVKRRSSRCVRCESLLDDVCRAVAAYMDNQKPCRNCPMIVRRHPSRE